MRKPYLIRIRPRTSLPQSRVRKWLHQAEMFILACAYLTVLALVAFCVLGFMVVAFTATVLVDLYHRWICKPLRSPA